MGGESCGRQSHIKRFSCQLTRISVETLRKKRLLAQTLITHFVKTKSAVSETQYADKHDFFIILQYNSTAAHIIEVQTDLCNTPSSLLHCLWFRPICCTAKSEKLPRIQALRRRELIQHWGLWNKCSTRGRASAAAETTYAKATHNKTKQLCLILRLFFYFR